MKRSRDNHREDNRGSFSRILLVAIVVLVVTDIMVVAVILSLWSSSGRILNEVQTQLAYIQDTNTIIQNEVSNMESNIEATLEAENSMLESYAIDVTGYDFVEGTYDVEVSVLPKEYTDTTQAMLYFGTQECYLSLNGLAYEGTATLPIGTNYDGNVTILFMDGNKKTTEVIKSYKGFQSSVKGMVSGSLGQNPTYTDGRLFINSKVDYSLDGNTSYEFETFELIVAAGGEELYYYDLLEESEDYTGEYLLDIEENEDEEHRMQEEAGVLEGTSLANDEAGDSIDNPSDLDESNADGADADEDDMHRTDSDETAIDEADTPAWTSQNITNKIERATVHPSIKSKSGQVSLRVQCEVKPSKKAHIFLRAITTDGLIIEYDLFGGYTKAKGDDFQFSDDYNRDNYILYDGKGGRFIP